MSREKFNLAIVFDPEEKHVLMCYRSKEPYKGLYNFVGGKIEENESELESTYRELFEETGIKKDDIILKPLIDFVWHPINMEMHVFYGVLKQQIELVDEIHKLYWISVTEDFFDLSKFAGEGNIGHMMILYKQWKNR